VRLMHSLFRSSNADSQENRRDQFPGASVPPLSPAKIPQDPWIPAGLISIRCPVFWSMPFSIVQDHILGTWSRRMPVNPL
jgi:hypothetical protein